MWAILGGSGFEKFENFKVIKSLQVDTPFGKPSADLLHGKIEAVDVLFLSRHGKEHEHTPSHINYRANIFALKQSGATKVLAISSVGSLQKELAPGDCVIPSQYIDRTKSIRAHTFCQTGVVGHVSLAHPVQLELVQDVKALIDREDYAIHFDKTYVCIEGPAFSTKAESKMNRQLGADIVGMTNFPEYALAREAGLCYLPLCFVTDYDCWDDDIEHVTVDKVIEIMRKNNKKAFDLMQSMILATNDLFPHGCPDGLKTGLYAVASNLSPQVKTWVDMLRA